MRTIVNYKNKDNAFWRTAIFLAVLFSVIPIACFVGEVVIIKNILIDNKLDQIPYIIFPILSQVFVFKYLQPGFLLADGCRFDITFHSDRFEYIGRFKKKTIYYTEVESLNNLNLLIAGGGYASEIEILRIKPKNKKRIQLSCKGLSVENAEKLKHDLCQYLGMNMNIEKKKFSLFNKTL